MNFVEVLEKFVSNSRFVTFLVSMIPVIELRGAIPIGMTLGLNPMEAMLISFVGNMVPVPVIVLFIRKIFSFLKKKSPWLRRIVEKLEKKAESKQELIHRWQVFGLFLLVAIPLPGTGAWTGSLVAALMDIRLKHALPAIALGVLTAGVIVLLISVGVAGVLA